MKKRDFLVMTVVLTSILIAGCGGKDSTSRISEAEGGKTKVVLGLAQDPSTLSPFTGGKAPRNYIQNECYQKLCQRDGFGGELRPVMIESYEKADEYTVKVKLLDYIYDSAGNHITSEDVAFSYLTAKDTGNYGRIASVEDVKALDDYNVQFDFNSPLHMGTLENALTEIYIVSKDAYQASEDQFSTSSVGTGPYYIEEFVPGSHAVLEKNDNYWQKNPNLNMYLYDANVDTIEVRIITDRASLAVAMQTGDVDMTTWLDFSDVEMFEPGGDSGDEFEVTSFLNCYLYSLLCNCSEESVCSNLNLRMAIAYALDTPAIGKAAFGDAAVDVYGYGNPQYVGYIPDWENDGYFDYDPDLAREYLGKFVDETGTDLNETVLRINVGNMPGFGTIAELTQAYLTAIGIKAEVNQYDPGTSSSLRKDPAAWDITSYTGFSNCYITENWDLMFDADDFASGGTMNFVFDDYLQELLDLVQTPDGYTPGNIDAFEKYLEDNCYILGISAQNDNAVYADFVTDIVRDGRGFLWPGACSYNWSLK